jgi:hypothetical protein
MVKLPDKWWQLLIVVIGTTVGVVVGSLLTYQFFSPRPNVIPVASWNPGPPIAAYNSPFRVDLKPDLEPWIKLVIVNEGNQEAEGFEVELKLRNDNAVAKVSSEYNPNFLSKRVMKLKQRSDKHMFYEKMSSLSVDGEVRHKIVVTKTIKSREDFRSSVTSKNHNWKLKVDMEVNSDTSSPLMFPTVVYGQEKPPETPVDCRYLPHYGSTFNGYYHVTIAYGLLDLIISKRLVTPEENKKISAILTSEKSAKLIMDGIPVLEFSRAVLNALVFNRVINIAQARKAIDVSSKGGWIKIEGYDPVILQLEILKILYTNNRITLAEGQGIIDCAKQNPGETAPKK